jgi:hypothetical protein
VPSETVRLRIGNLAKAVLVSGQAYQDPKDALNEFVSNAADEYVEGDRRGERIRVILRRRGRHPVIAIDDVGRGMDVDRLRQVARSLFDSEKAGDARTLGEKAIGILAFQQLGGRCDIVTRPEGSDVTHTLRLERGKATARLDLHERRRARQIPGTTVYISDLDPDALRVLTQRKVVEYLRRRRGPALARGEYVIEVVEGRSGEIVTPEQPDGMRVDLPPHPTLSGRIDFSLFVAPRPDRERRVAVVGRAGTTIIDDLTELEEFDRAPWSTDQVSGQISFEALQQTAGRRAIVRDREAFPVFLDAVGAIEPAVVRLLEKVTAEVDQEVAGKLSDTLRRVFGRVLKELADLDNPMRTPLGSEPGEGGIFAAEPPSPVTLSELNGNGADHVDPPCDDDLPDLATLAPPLPPDSDLVAETREAKPDRVRSQALPSVAPDPDPTDARSRFDADAGVVFYNDRHADYLFAKDDEAALLDYLATLVAKEYVVYNNPRAAADELAEEMVRMLVRVRRHLPKRK